MDDDPRNYTFTSAVEYPSGVLVTVTTVVPTGHVSYSDAKGLAAELSEITQMGASHTANRLADSFKAHYERCPF